MYSNGPTGRATCHKTMDRLLPRRSDRLGSPAAIRRRAKGGGFAAVCASPTFILGSCAGMAVYWASDQMFLMWMSDPNARKLAHTPVPSDPPAAGGYHAILIPAGGQGADGPPAHVLARLERAVAMWRMSAEPKP